MWVDVGNVNMNVKRSLLNCEDMSMWKGEEMLSSRVGRSDCANGHQAGPFIRRPKVVNPR